MALAHKMRLLQLRTPHFHYAVQPIWTSIAVFCGEAGIVLPAPNHLLQAAVPLLLPAEQGLESLDAILPIHRLPRNGRNGPSRRDTNNCSGLMASESGRSWEHIE